MKNFIHLANKQKKIVLGLMSGTSLNGIDAALVEIENSGIDTKLKLKGFIEYPFPEGFKDYVLKNSFPETSRVDDICRLNFLIPQIYNTAIDELCKQINFDKNDIDLIGSHGQTIYHLPGEKKQFGYNASSTLQIGDPSVLAKLTGITTVGNFRVGDMALGGQGAPLVPYFDFIVFHSDLQNRLLLNIGGISNVTLLKTTAEQKDTFAFDTGPGNMLLDIAAKRFLDSDFDKDGEVALSGNLNTDLWNALLVKDRHIESEPPKSTGREVYGEAFLLGLFDEFSSVSVNDWLHTLAKFTAYGVFRNYEKFLKQDCRVDELIISGGGAKNKAILNFLNEMFGNDVEVKVIDEIGISADAKEAICFAVLANEAISGVCSNIPLTTGASKETILGAICLP